MYYGKHKKVGGLWAGPVMRGSVNGQYTVVYEREYASLEQIEAVDWAHLTVEGEETVLPRGYGYKLERIDYESSSRCFRVTLRVAEQYLGDVTGYQAEIDGLRKDLTEKTAALQEATDLIQGMVDAEVEGIMSEIGGENDDV